MTENKERLRIRYEAPTTFQLVLGNNKMQLFFLLVRSVIPLESRFMFELSMIAQGLGDRQHYVGGGLH